ncbi:MAG: polysaccharide biosynthesis protein [Phycisphaeraceae bacterium]
MSQATSGTRGKHRSAPAGEGGGGPRTLLVGTAVSVAQLHHTLSVATPPPRIVGCLLPRPAVEAATLPCPVLGAIDELEARLHDAAPVGQVLVSLPLAMTGQVRAVAGVLDRLGVTWRFMPTLGDQLAGRTTSRLTGALPTRGQGGAPALFGADSPIDPAQLLDRTPRPLHEDAIRACLQDRTVLITGAGGSIGSELARIVSRFAPARLLLVERGENALFEIDREIGRVFAELPRRAILHDVTHRAATHELLAEHKPDVIFHAAAHKHVPMMEDHPAHAVENNFYGTRSIADAAAACGAERFVMISTDKAVNPSSVMGATKRLAELYVQDLNARSTTAFAAVRFGNVLGSACSVLPIWADQLAHGGPITVTHPEMTRYFMTIPEAAGLVLQAAAMAAESFKFQVSSFKLPEGAGEIEGGSVFLLDMGEPVRIVDLAHRFVRAQGLEPNVDVRIAFTGARPGEKLFESLAYDSEDLTPTAHDSIHRWRTPQPDPARIAQIVRTFDRLRDRADDPAHPWRGVGRETILSALRSAIPEMVDAVAG